MVLQCCIVCAPTAWMPSLRLGVDSSSFAPQHPWSLRLSVQTISAATLPALCASTYTDPCSSSRSLRRFLCSYIASSFLRYLLDLLLPFLLYLSLRRQSFFALLHLGTCTHLCSTFGDTLSYTHTRHFLVHELKTARFETHLKLSRILLAG